MRTPSLRATPRSTRALALCLAAALTVAGLPSTALAADDGPPDEVVLPDVIRGELDNGLRTLFLPNRKNPFVEVRLMVRAGTAIDPADRDGLVALMTSQLTSGTPTRDEDAITNQVATLGGTLGASGDLNTVELSASVITLEADALPALLEIFADVWRNATFPEDALAREKTLRQARVARLVDQHSALADAALDAVLYEGEAKGRLGIGTLATIPTFTRDELVEVRDALLMPEHAVLAVAGDFDPAWMARWADEALGGPWREGSSCRGMTDLGFCEQVCAGERCFTNPAATATADAAGSGPGKVAVLVDRADPSMTQVQWRLGQRTPVPMTHPEWGAFRLGTQILGGDFTARLNSVLRVREGLTYGARFNVDWGARRSGPMAVSTYVKPADFDRAVGLALEEITRIRTEAVPTPELEGFKGKITNAFPFKFETVSDTLRQYLYLDAAGVDVGWLRGYQAAIRAPDAARVQAALQRIDPDAMTLVVVGNRDLLPVLAKWSGGQVRVVSARAMLDSGLASAETVTVEVPADKTERK